MVTFSHDQIKEVNTAKLQASGSKAVKPKSSFSNTGSSPNGSNTRNGGTEKSVPLYQKILDRLTVKDSNDRSWLEKGLLEDGFDEGDIWKTVLASITDMREDLWTGAVGIVEGITDSAMMIAPVLLGTDKTTATEFVQKDLINEQSVVRQALAKAKGIQELYALGEANGVITAEDVEKAKQIIADEYKYMNERVEEESVLGEKLDSAAQSGGQLLATSALGMAKVPWWLVSGLSAAGGEAESALNEGATYEEALLSAAISGAAEVLTEKLSGAIKFGGKAADDALVMALSRGVSNKLLRNGLKFGLDVTGEGAEEVITSLASEFGQWLTYRDDEELKEVLFSEQAMDEKIEAFFSGALMGGGSSAVNIVSSKAMGVDATSGLTANEEQVVNKVYQDRVAEAEKDGKVTQKRKNQIYDEVVEAMDKGEISTDKIEEILGGDSYKAYKDAADEQDTLKKELDELRRMKKGDMNDIQLDRLAELKGMNLDDTSNRDSLKAMLGSEVSELVKGDRLAESYNQKAQRGKGFSVDLNKVDEKQRHIYQKAMDSQVVNNSTRAHEFVGLVARIAADKGIDFDFTNNQKLKDSGLAIGNAHISGYVNEDGVTINMQSAKALNKVVGHEVTHGLEGTELYDALQQAAFDYAKSKGELTDRWRATKALYKDLNNIEINKEITADLVGDYLFGDKDFVKSLYSGNRNLFEKIYDEVKYLCKVVTAGSKEARQLEKVKKVFADAYHVENTTQKNTADGGVRYSLGDIKYPRTNIDYNDINVRRTTEDSLTESLVEREKVTQVSIEDIPQEFANTDWTDSKKARLCIKKILEHFLGEDVVFNLGDNSAIAYLTSRGINHAASGANTESKAASFAKFYEIVSKAEYCYSCPKDTHSKTPGREDWDYFVSVAKMGEETIPLVFAVRSIDQDVRSQIYSIATKTDPTISHGDGTQENPANAHPNYGDSSSPNEIIPQDGSMSSGTDSQALPDNNIGPVRNTDIGPVREIKPALSEDIAPVRKSGNYNIMSEDVYFDPTKKDIAPVRADIRPVNKAAQNAPQNRIIAPVPIKNKKQGIISKIVNRTVDNGMVFENLSLKSGNMELQSKWDYALPSKAEARAQWFMRNGRNGSASLESVRKKVEDAGKTEAFQDYMRHWRNVDSMTLSERFGVNNKPVFGTSVSADISRKKIAQYEKQNPEFKGYADELYSYFAEERKMMVESGLITEEQAKHMEEMYPHYIPLHREADELLGPVQTNNLGVNTPIKSATGGNRPLHPMFDTIAQHTLQTFKAVARNDFGVELKNTIQTTARADATDADEIFDSIENQNRLLGEGSDGSGYTFSVYENGQKVTFNITEAMYDALKPTDGLLGERIKPLTKLNDIRRNLITSWNTVFALYRNPVKDIQDVMINSQHPIKTYMNVPKAAWELWALGKERGKWATEYLQNGGEQNTYYDNRKGTFTREDSMWRRIIGFPAKGLESAGEFIERVPRLAEYIASRESGRSVQRSMLDAARVTTNFAAGGDFTKFLNSHGFTFLNAGVQGFSQNVRNFREAKMNGFKGYVQLAAKFTVAGLSAGILNGLFWDEEDDEDYEELSDYVKQNYYVVAKTSDGKFVRIPKGRMAAVIQYGMEQMEHLVTGDDEADFESFFKLVMDNLAPGNPLDNNILAPIAQVLENKTWYGEDLVPSRLADLPAAEQFDESTDSLSKWLGEKMDISPYKINYLIDQYSGGLGDVFLPMMTPEAESGDNSFFGNLKAPWKKEWTTDSVLNNKHPSEFFELSDELEVISNGKNATDEDKVRNLYMSSVGWEMSDLYAEKREIQNSDLPDDQKYEAVREVQKEINALTENALNHYERVNVDGLYATVGGKRFDYSEYKEQWYEIDGEYLEKEQRATNRYGITPSEYWNDTDLYYHADWYFDNQYADPHLEEVAKLVFGGKKFAPYAAELSQFKADKDQNGNSISGSKKTKIFDYIDSLKISDVEKAIMKKMNYTSYDDYNKEILDYLNNRGDLSYIEKKLIIETLGAKVDGQGRIKW